jgi:hypothetical protein
MSVDVLLVVAFVCPDNDPVAVLAKQHLAALPPPTEDGHGEARDFLEALAGRSGPTLGTKGGMSVWGTVGNYVRPDAFIAALAPFWEDLLPQMPSERRVMVFSETEQREVARVFSVFRSRDGSITASVHECDWAWYL